MGFKKRVIAIALATAVVFGSAFTAFAATDSATTAPTTTSGTEETKTHNDNGVIANAKNEVTKVTAEGTSAAAKSVTLKTYADKPIVAINKNAFKGSVITKVNVASTKNVTIKAKAFNKSKVKKLVVSGKKVTIKKNAFKGTKAKKLTLNVKNVKKLSLKKGAFKGLKKITIKGASKKQKAKIIKAIKKAGFNGTIK